ncbi:MAG TPA: hypothetical protein DCZ92_07130, partial [Elusimicrobia bacterium]|nr:hypothetical protein [Elusimicrobiota bacterium]
MNSALTDLLHAACSPSNLEVFLNKTLQILGGHTVFGSKAGLALVTGSGLRPAAIFKNFTKKEQALILAGKQPAGGLFLKVPLPSAGKERGMIAVRLDVCGPGKTEADSFLKTTAELAGARLAQERRDRALNRERDNAAAIRHIEELYLACPGISLKEISRAVLDEGRRLTGSAFGFAGYLDPAAGSLVAITLTDDVWKKRCRVKDSPYIFKEFNGLWGWVLKKKKPLLTNDAAADPRASGVPQGHIKIDRFLGVPAIYDGKLLGILALANPAGPYGAQDLETAGRLAQVYAIILKRVLEEMRLAQESDKRQAIIASSRDIIYSAGADGKFTYISSRVRDYGYEPEELVGRSVLEFIHPEDVELAAKAFTDAIRSGKTLPLLSYRILKKDGSFFYA